MASVVPLSIENGLVVAVEGSSTLAVDVNGAVLPAVFVGSYAATVGDLVRVLLVDGTATVLGHIHTSARPVTGQVVSVGSGIATVSTSIGNIQARYMGSAPANLSTVRIDWSATPPWLFPGAVAGATIAGPNRSAGSGPRGSATSGTLSVSATSSGSWRPGFNIWQSGDVKQGAYGSGQPYNGAWFYGKGAFNTLKGKTITAVEIRVASRLRIGNFNSSLALQFYRHATNSPGGNPNETGSVASRTIPANSGRRWIDLPVSFGEALRDGGGGISLSGGSYGGVRGRSADATSGQLRISWRT